MPNGHGKSPHSQDRTLASTGGLNERRVREIVREELGRVLRRELPRLLGEALADRPTQEDGERD